MCKCISCSCRQEISWKEAKNVLKLGNPDEYYRCFSTKERRLCNGLKSKKQDRFVKVEIFSPIKDSPIILKGGATIEFSSDSKAYFKGVTHCG